MINGGDGADTILNDTNLGVRLSGGNGNDSVWGGAAMTCIAGDAGDDLARRPRPATTPLDGGAGNDSAVRRRRQRLA